MTLDRIEWSKDNDERETKSVHWVLCVSLYAMTKKSYRYFRVRVSELRYLNDCCHFESVGEEEEEEREEELHQVRF